MAAAELGYVVPSLAWGLGGLVIGYWLGTMTREVHELREALVAEQDAHYETRHGSPPDGDRRSGHDRRRGSRMNYLIGAVLIVLAVGSVTFTALESQERNRVTECQSNYNLAFSRALNERVKAAQKDRAAIRELVQTVAQSRSDGGAIDAAFQRFLDATAEADGIRRNNPTPPFPLKRCR